MDDKKDLKKKHDNENAAVKPDPETLHKTDPQDNMEGPISSLVQKVKEEVGELSKNEKTDDNKK